MAAKDKCPAHLKIFIVRAPNLLPSTLKTPFVEFARDADEAINQVTKHMWGSPADYTAELVTP